MKPAAAPVAILSACLFAGGVSRAQTPSVLDLPRGELPSLPRLEEQPAHIEATELVDGLTVIAASREVHIDGAPERCLRGLMEDDRVLAGTTSHTFVRSMTLVSPVRSERVVVLPDGDASLEITDVWIDPRTGGARRIATHALPLRKLANAPESIAVYGVTIGESVHIVVTSAGVTTFRDGDGSVARTACAHARVALSASRGSGEQAIFHLISTEKSTDPTRRAALPLRVTASLSQLASEPAPLLSVRVARLLDEPRLDHAQRPPLPRLEFQH